jgi:putative ABC transport system permease protein
VLLGLGLARALDAKAGDVITIMATTANATLNALDVTVAGVFTTGFQDLDDRIVQTHVATAQRLLATDSVTSLIVGLRDTDMTRDSAIDLRTALAGHPVPLAIVDWESRAPFYGQVRALYGGIFTFMGAIIAVLVALSNSNTLLMSIFERIREYGTLLAIGTSRAQLAGLLLMEAFWLATIGGLAGGALGLVAAAGINWLAIEMPPPPAAVDPLTLSLSVAAGDLLWAVAFMIAVLGLAAIAPILRVLRLQIVDALGHV